MKGLSEQRRFELVPLLTERIFLIYYLLIAGLFLYHNDLGWHLAAGDYIREHGKVPKLDPWSYTAGNYPWVNYSWGWDYIASWLHERFGMLALQVVTACIGAWIIGKQAMLAVKMHSALVPTLIAVLLGGMALPQFTPPDVFIAIAPQVVTLVSITMFNYLIYRAIEENRTYLFAVLPFIMLVWANMHGGFVLGFFILGIYLIDVMWRSKWHQVRPVVCAIAACSITATITPWGLDGLFMFFKIVAHTSDKNITEWQSVWERFQGGTDLPSIMYLLLFIPALIGMLRARVIPMPMFLICVVLYVQAWFQIRYISLFIVFSMPLMAWGLSHLGRGNMKPSSIRITMAPMIGVMGLTLVIVAFLILNVMDRTVDLPEVRWPKEEIAYIEKHYKDRNLVNHWNYGSFIIYQTRGELKPFIDGRADTAYPLSVFENYARLYPKEEWPQVLKNYNIGVVLWPKIDTKMQAFFRSNPDWKLVYEGRLAFVYAKQ